MSIKGCSTRLFGWFLLLLSGLLLACERADNIVEWEVNGRETKILLNRISDSHHSLQLNIDGDSCSVWKLPYPVYRFDYGDVTGDGNPEIAVGVIKPTRFDPKPSKRLFLYRVANGIYIRPLWLGSRVAQPLEDFRIIRSQTPALIRTMERERSGCFLVAEYRWRGFGLEFQRYLQREMKQADALRILNH